jgi:NAD-dependent dihydropyrimidine dehydrogenase PreA subunit
MSSCLRGTYLCHVQSSRFSLFLQGVIVLNWPDGSHREEESVTYVIALPCVDIKDRACVEECPVDCIYEGGRSLYIHPDECVDCGACEPVCPVEAISYEEDLPEKWAAYIEDNARFFTETLPGLDAPLGSPGGAAKLGVMAADTPLVHGLPPHPMEG